MEGRDVERNANVLLPALLSAYPNDDIDPGNTSMYYWTDDAWEPSINDRYMLPIKGENVQYSPQSINNDSASEFLPFGCVCVRQPERCPIPLPMIMLTAVARRKCGSISTASSAPEISWTY